MPLTKSLGLLPQYYEIRLSQNPTMPHHVYSMFSVFHLSYIHWGFYLISMNKHCIVIFMYPYKPLQKSLVALKIMKLSRAVTAEIRQPSLCKRNISVGQGLHLDERVA